jgi:hypothetical protein
MPPKKASGISFGTTKGVSEISVSYIFKASWTSPDKIKVLLVEFKALTAVKVVVVWDAPDIVWQIDTNIWEEPVASFFRIKGQSFTASDNIVHC